MSCIFRDPEGKIILMCKGADTVITERLNHFSLHGDNFYKTQTYVDSFADEGLRTLYLAEKVIEEDVFLEWSEKKRLAALEIVDREEKVAAVDELIETEMDLIGASAIEDKLQDEVADTIQFMKKTGIKVWVLTGDKIETAMNIGVSAGLLDSQMAEHIIEDTNITELRNTLINTLDVVKMQKQMKQAIIVAGSSLIIID